jgi:hypothetical protein
MVAHGETFIAECFWPNVHEADLAELDRRVERTAAALNTVRYLGSILLREDEVVLCEFEGAAVNVREVARLADIPFERIIAARRSPWAGGASDRLS